MPQDESKKLYRDEIGEYYKDEEAYRSGEGICYISANTFEDPWWEENVHTDADGRQYWDVADIEQEIERDSSEIDAWTKQRFLNFTEDSVGQREVLADMVFQSCEWESPWTVLDQFDEEDWAEVAKKEYENHPGVDDPVAERISWLENLSQHGTLGFWERGELDYLKVYQGEDYDPLVWVEKAINEFDRDYDDPVGERIRRILEQIEDGGRTPELVEELDALQEYQEVKRLDDYPKLVEKSQARPEVNGFEEEIRIFEDSNGHFINSYGYDDKPFRALATEYGFETLEEAREAALAVSNGLDERISALEQSVAENKPFLDKISPSNLEFFSDEALSDVAQKTREKNLLEGLKALREHREESKAAWHQKEQAVWEEKEWKDHFSLVNDYEALQGSYGELKSQVADLEAQLKAAQRENDRLRNSSDYWRSSKEAVDGQLDQMRDDLVSSQTASRMMLASLCREAGLEPDVSVESLSYYNNMLSKAIGDLRTEAAISREAIDPHGLLDPKGHVVLEQYGRDAVVYLGHEVVDPYVVAPGYDASTGEWSGSGSYFPDPGSADDLADPEVIESLTVKFDLIDLAEALEKYGIEDSEQNIDEALAFDASDPRFFEHMKEDMYDSGMESLSSRVESLKDRGRFDKAPVDEQERVSGDKPRDNSRAGKGFSLESQCETASKAKDGRMPLAERAEQARVAASGHEEI